MKRYRSSPQAALATATATVKKFIAPTDCVVIVLAREEFFNHVVTVLPRDGLYGAPIVPCRHWPKELKNDLMPLGFSQTIFAQDHDEDAIFAKIDNILMYFMEKVVSLAQPLFGPYPIVRLGFSKMRTPAPMIADKGNNGWLNQARIAEFHWNDSSGCTHVQPVVTPASFRYSVSPSVRMQLVPFNHVVRGD